MALRTSEQDFGYDAERREYEYNRYYKGGDSLYQNGNIELRMHSDGFSMVSVLLDHENKTIDFISRFDKESGPQRKEECWSQYEIWKDKYSKYKAAELLVMYVLPKLKIISSDKYQTADGEKLWKNLLSYYKTNPCGIYDLESDYVLYYEGKNIKDLLDECYSNKSYRFFISTK